MIPFRKIAYVILAAASGGIAFSPAATSAQDIDENALVLKPSSPWNLDYADDSCRLTRVFGKDKQRVAFYIERTGHGDSFSMVAAGRPLKGSTRKPIAYVKFGAELEEVRLKPTLGKLASYEPALIFGSTRFSQVENSENEGIAGDAAASPQLEQDIAWISFRRVGRNAVVLKTGALSKPMQAMRKCTRELLTNWGIDIEKHKKLKHLPKPANKPQHWITARDYPKGLLRQGQPGIVHFRMSVNEQGVPTACHIQQATRPQGFNEIVCEKLMKRARFEPAVTRDGEKIASYYRSTVRFEIRQ